MMRLRLIIKNVVIKISTNGVRFAVLTFLACSFLWMTPANGQSSAKTNPWHGKERHLHYKPEGNGFKLVKGTRRFNRALYGTNTGFRVETGDLPEFALYLPGMGGNIRFAIKDNANSKWLTDADSIATLYTPGKMQYTIQDKILGSGKLEIEVLAFASTEGALIKVTPTGVPSAIELTCIYGGVTGKKFSRDGDIGADPESVFFLTPENCRDNKISIADQGFQLSYTNASKFISGSMPANAALTVADASMYGKSFPANSKSQINDNPKAPVVKGTLLLENNASLLYAWQPGNEAITARGLTQQYSLAIQATKKLSERVILNTPDPWLNTLGGTLAAAGDAIWESPTYLHGAVAWRMRLPAWRGANVADPLGWHDRAKLHFSSYAKSQVVTPLSAPVVMDTGRNLARHLEQIGTGMFTSGYICRNPNGDIRPHHYDMNLVFIDQLLTHFEWTGDTSFVREMWPVITRHLDWEKRNFDTDGDGLYDAYCCIWASDALHYTGGGVTHSSAYNYRAFSHAAKLAKLLGVDGSTYQQEATKIWNAMQQHLWLPKDGWFAEYKDLLGNQLVHPSAGIWTIYHAMDSRVPDAFQAYQMMRYIDKHIPHIPVEASGLEGNYNVISTTNWMPYTWSINNVALAEMLHTSLAYWQAGRSYQGFNLWKSALIESMYLGASPGGFHQLSFYDAVRSELYRDFADPVGMAARSLVEGLFGIRPDALADTLTIAPGFPSDWPFAELKIPDVDVKFSSTKDADSYSIVQSFAKPMHLQMMVKAKGSLLPEVTVNGKRLIVAFIKDAVGEPTIVIKAEKASTNQIKIVWKGENLLMPTISIPFTTASGMTHDFGDAKMLAVNDPQQVFREVKYSGSNMEAIIQSTPGHKTFFVQLQQNDATWWAPLDVEVVAPITFSEYTVSGDMATLKFESAYGLPIYEFDLNNGKTKLKSGNRSTQILWEVPISAFITGTNKISIKKAGKTVGDLSFTYWQKQVSEAIYESVNLKRIFNANVKHIFEQQYLSPRPESPSLQLPTQGIGNWCYPLITANINDSGFRAKAAYSNYFATPYGFGFATPGEQDKSNIAFVSQWDNYPKQLEVPLTGTASHAYFLMAGTTNHMQSRFENARIMVHYQDGTSDSLSLINPDNWWPIEQDFFDDGYAFNIGKPRPPRVYLQDGIVSTNPLPKYSSIKGFSNMAVEGGAATILDLPLNKNKQLKNITLQVIANEVVVGLMGVTLKRE